MSAAGYSISSGAFTFTSVQTKTVIQAINAANSLVRLTEMSLSLEGVTASAIPGTMQLFKSTQAGAGTATGGTTINQTRGPTRTVQATSGGAYSAEPTVLTVHRAYYVPQYNGLFVLQFPLGREPEQSTSSHGIGFRYISSATVVCIGNLEFEEG